MGVGESINVEEHIIYNHKNKQVYIKTKDNKESKRNPLQMFA